MVYVTRNPRDACVSYLNHAKVIFGYTGDLGPVVDSFLADDQPGVNLPFFHHVLGYWEKSKAEENICFVTYEEMKRDLAGVIKRIGKFLDKPVADEDMPKLLDHLSFDKMKTNAMVNKQDLVNTMSRKNLENRGLCIRIQHLTCAEQSSRGPPLTQLPRPNLTLVNLRRNGQPMKDWYR